MGGLGAESGASRMGRREPPVARVASEKNCRLGALGPPACVPASLRHREPAGQVTADCQARSCPQRHAQSQTPRASHPCLQLCPHPRLCWFLRGHILRPQHRVGFDIQWPPGGKASSAGTRDGACLQLGFCHSTVTSDGLSPGAPGSPRGRLSEPGAQPLGGRPGMACGGSLCCGLEGWGTPTEEPPAAPDGRGLVLQM